MCVYIYTYIKLIYIIYILCVCVCVYKYIYIYIAIPKPYGNHKPKIYNRYTNKKEKAIQTLKIVIKSQENKGGK